jgi:hypothetical protein
MVVILLLLITGITTMALFCVLRSLRRKQQSNTQDKRKYENIRFSSILRRSRPQSLPEVHSLSRQQSTMEESGNPGYEPLTDHLSPLLASKMYESVHMNTEEVEENGEYL